MTARAFTSAPARETLGRFAAVWMRGTASGAFLLVVLDALTGVVVIAHRPGLRAAVIFGAGFANAVLSALTRRRRLK